MTLFDADDDALTEEPPEEDDELKDMMEFGRRDVFMSGKVLQKEFRNFGANLNKKKGRI